MRGPKHVVKKGKTPVLKAEEARELLDSIPIMIDEEPNRRADTRPPILIGLRDRALIAVMVLQLRPHQRRPRHEGGGLLHRRPAGMVPAA